ncbi:MAG: DinB family protein [Bacteroidetes bacterium]|nr:DinB family protein [Bacteroidota bacterium]
MNQLILTCHTLLDQLTHSVKPLTTEEFACPLKVLSGASIGQHVRHTLEFFMCLEKGFEAGIINYDKRTHDKNIEGRPERALQAIQLIKTFIGSIQTDKPLTLQIAYDEEGSESIEVQTNSYREIIYNIEHTVHHMAIMKIGFREVAPHVILPVDFGVAASTLRYRQENFEKAH